MDELLINTDRFGYTALAAGPVDGEFVLLLHGWPQFADSWSAVLPALGSAGYRAVAVDQRGYATGARPAPIACYTVENLVADALAFAESQGAHRFHLIAHDWGGMVAWALASAYPERLRTLSVLATPHPEALREAGAADEDQFHRLDYVRFFREPGAVAEAALLADDAARLRNAYGGHVPEGLVNNNVRRLTEPGALTATLNWYRAVEEETGGFGVPAGKITTPTLYVWGSEDTALGRDAAERTAAFVAAPYRFVVLDGASHWLPEQVPDALIPLLLHQLDQESTEVPDAR